MDFKPIFSVEQQEPLLIGGQKECGGMCTEGAFTGEDQVATGKF